jgi:hypothetical protein
LKQGRFDQDLRKAIRLSLQDQNQMMKKENNKSLEDDSFDMLSNYDHGFKVKKAADRKLLKGIGMYKYRGSQSEFPKRLPKVSWQAFEGLLSFFSPSLKCFCNSNIHFVVVIGSLLMLSKRTLGGAYYYK